MEVIQKNHVLFLLRKSRKKLEKQTIYIRICIDSQRSEFSSQQKVFIKDWDNKKGRVKPSDRRSVLINNYLEKAESKISDIIYKANRMDGRLSPDEVKLIFLGKDPESFSKNKTLIQAFDYHNDLMEKEVEIGKVVKKTYTRYEITKDKISTFMKTRKRMEDIPLKDLKLAFIREFEHYLLTEDDLQSNTAHKYIRNVKKVVNMAIGLEWLTFDPFSQFKCKYKNPERVVLTQEEIDALIKKDFKIKRLEEVRDVFVFCCYTGFSYSDVFNFEHDALSRGIDGEHWLSANRQKTGVKETVPLLPVAYDVVMKYRDHEECIRKNKLLPVNTNQRYNGYLKEIADICGIDKKLTTHIARHTFATTITLSNGVPIETVSAMLGHNSIRTTQIYAKVVEKKVSEDMQSLKAKLFGCNPKNKDDRKIG
ncbi:MAG: site-specific integrase [Brumimicrobium sp.]